MQVRYQAALRPEAAYFTPEHPLAGGSRHVIALHEVVHAAVEARPRRLAEVVRPHGEGGPEVELFVGLVAAGELAADELPGELEELHALERAVLRRVPVGLEFLLQLAILDHRGVRGHLENAAAAELAQVVHDRRVALDAPVERGVEVAAVVADEAARPGLAILDLRHDQAADERLLGS